MNQVVIQPTQWGEVPHMDTMDRQLDVADSACLSEIREVLERYGNLKRFGIYLLHRHFSISDAEVLVETIDTETRTLTVTPMLRSEIGSAIPTQWCLESDNPAQWCQTSCIWSGNSHTKQDHRVRNDIA